MKTFLLLFVLIMSINAQACYLGSNILCCHPMIGCEIDTQDFLKNLNAYKTSLTKDEAISVESEIYFSEVEIINDEFPTCIAPRQTHCNHPTPLAPITCLGMHMPMKTADGHWYCKNMGGH